MAAGIRKSIQNNIQCFTFVRIYRELSSLDAKKATD